MRWVRGKLGDLVRFSYIILVKDKSMVTRYEVQSAPPFSPLLSCPPCPECTFIQAVRITEAGQHVQTNPKATARQTPAGWAIDQVADAKFPWYPVDNNGNYIPLLGAPGKATPQEDAMLLEITPGGEIMNAVPPCWMKGDKVHNFVVQCPHPGKFESS